MIDADACHGACAYQLKNEPVNGVKNFGQLDPNRRQFIHVKKAAVIDFLGSDAPKGQTIRLCVQQFVELIETARVARIPVDLCEGFFDCLLYLRRLAAAIARSIICRSSSLTG